MHHHLHKIEPLEIDSLWFRFYFPLNGSNFFVLFSQPKLKQRGNQQTHIFFQEAVDQ